MNMCTCILLLMCVSGAAQAAQITAEATVPGDSREAEIDAVQAALRAVVDSAVVRIIGPDLSARYPRDIEARIHAQRKAYVTRFNIPFIPPERDTPYDGKTYRRVRAEVRMEALADSLVAMGLAWRDGHGQVRPCQEITVNLLGFTPDDARATSGALVSAGDAARSLGPVVITGGMQERFLVPGDAWALARALAKTGGGQWGITAAQGSIVDVRMGSDPAQRPSPTRGDLPPLEIQEAWIDEVFPARQAIYRTHQVGRVVVALHEPHPAARVELEILCPEYLDVPLIIPAGSLQPSETKTVPLVIPFSAHKLLSTKTQTQAMARVAARCWVSGGQKEAAATVTFTVHGRNALDWEDVESVCAFITPEADDVQRLTRIAANFVVQGEELLPGRLELGFKVIRALTSLSLRYVPDPTATGSAYDRVQFAGETLRLRSGDCEDSAVLLASCLEGGDIPAELLLTRDHVFAAFSTGLHEKDGFLVSPERELYIIRDGMVWIPVETTLLAQGFLPAWDEGVRTFRELEKSGDYLQRVSVREGWQTYPPASPELAGDFSMPSAKGAESELQVWEARRQRGIEAVEKGLRSAVARHPQDHGAAYGLGVVLGRTGRIEEARAVFAGIPDGHELGAWARVGEGNCLLLNAQADSAVARFIRATELSPEDPASWVNLGVAYQVAGDDQGAAMALGRALGTVGGNEDALARLLGVRLDELATKADDAESSRALTQSELRSLMERARASHGGKRVAQRGESRHKFAGRKALDPEQRLKAGRLIYWPEPQV